MDREDPTGEISWEDLRSDIADLFDDLGELPPDFGGPEFGAAGDLIRGAEEARGVSQESEAAVDLADRVPEVEASSAKEPGSYTNIHESGREYHGKGSRARSQVSGRRVEAETGDKHVATDWKASSSDQQAFVDEAKRIEQGGGVKSPNNYNKINSPGNKHLQSQQDTQKPMGVVKICNGPCDWER